MQDREEKVNQERLLELYRKAVDTGNVKLSDISYEALRVAAKAEALTAEARRLAVLANEL